jgi:hypothetical protein
MIEQAAVTQHEQTLKDFLSLRLAQMPSVTAAQEQFTELNQSAIDLVQDLRRLRSPWVDDEAREADDSQSFREQWIAAAGFDPTDKEQLAAWDKQVQSTLKEAAESADTDSTHAAQQQLIASRARAVIAKRKAQQR